MMAHLKTFLVYFFVLKVEIIYEKTKNNNYCLQFVKQWANITRSYLKENKKFILHIDFGNLNKVEF